MNQELWQQILDFDLDEPISEYPFSVRLSYENGWTTNFAKGAILEYKKFMYLAATTQDMVSPSGVIDVVWHQHLIFTLSYANFCDLIGKRIEHVPSTRIAGQAEKFKAAKIQTDAEYERLFGKQPKGYWDFDTMTDELELPKAKRSLSLLLNLGLAGFTLLLIPTYFLLFPFYAKLDNQQFAFGSILLCLFAFGFLEYYNSSRFHSFFEGLHRKSFLFDLTSVELVYCKYRKLSEVVHSSVSRLIREDRLAINENNRICIGTSSEPTKNPLTHAIFKTIEELNPEAGAKYEDLVERMTKKRVLGSISKSIRKTEEYFSHSKFLFATVAVNIGILFSAYLLVFVRLITGLVRHKPVGILTAALILLLVATIYYVYRLQTIIMHKFLMRHYIETYKHNRENYDADWNYFAMGQAAIIASFLPVYERSRAGSSWSNWGGSDTNGNSCSSGCGSSCGSSCGSCGGCGGD